MPLATVSVSFLGDQPVSRVSQAVRDNVENVVRQETKVKTVLLANLASRVKRALR